MIGFTAHPTTQIDLTHGDQTVTLALRALPVGYGDVIAEVMPPPKPMLGQDKPDPVAYQKWLTRRGMVLLAKCLGDQLSAKPPPSNMRGSAWEHYADAVLAEFEAAHFVEGDLQRLLDEMGKLNRGLGDLPKA